ncbi:hypothetical protein TNIN_369561 [Trichonephila inaurata madagascariensis]|uniref:Uncharacterized protein n=1 Tax=Trichonephila inaurata madagascariensis TaxID=2747483 RepID=A0A8X6X299_9ARAC|nr:hypothetical protein TNIN_369561 [Trichonephila inaurata madagascariensis]
MLCYISEIAGLEILPLLKCIPGVLLRKMMPLYKSFSERTSSLHCELTPPFSWLLFFHNLTIIEEAGDYFACGLLVPLVIQAMQFSFLI